MKLTKDHIRIGALIAVAVLITLLITGMFRKAPKPAVDFDEYTKMVHRVLEAKDETIAAKDQQNKDLDQLNQAHEERDSILTIQLTNNKPKYVSNSKNMQAAIDRVNSSDKQQLRREYAEY
jgi:uncharacterized membrane protein (DUF106 family)